MSPTLDRRLAQRAAGGDLAAFEEIFRRYQQDLYRFCVGILREPQDAQDAVQNTMVRALRALPGETREMQLRPWLYRIAHNEAVELRRRERRVDPLGLAVEDAAPGTEERIEQGARLRTLLADIADLPERQRATLVMRELNGLAFGEIAAALDTSPGAVRQALYEARRGLSQMESGREMDCDAAMRQVSDADGSPTRRGIRAHLRDCLRCRHFQAQIRERQEILAGISPMPVLAVAALVKGGLGGSGAAAGGSSMALGGASATVGGAGIGSSGLGALGVPGLVKAAVGVITVLTVGTVAVDHGVFVGSGPGSGRSSVARSQVRGVEAAAIGRPEGVAAQVVASRRVAAPAAAPGRQGPARPEPEGSSAAGERGNGRSPVGGPPSGTAPGTATAPRGLTAAPATGEKGSTPTADAETKSASSDAPGATAGAAEGDGKSQAEHPGKGEEQARKAEERETAKAERSEAKAEKAQAKSEKAEAKAERSEAKEHPEHPARPENGNGAVAAETASTGSPAPPASESPPVIEHPEGPAHPAHPEKPPAEGVGGEATEVGSG